MNEENSLPVETFSRQIQSVGQCVASMQQNIALLGQNIRRIQLEQAALLGQIQRMEQPLTDYSTPPDRCASFSLVSGAEVDEVEDQNRQIVTELGDIRHVIEMQRKDLSSLTATMHLMEKKADCEKAQM
jgi:hypothetical protein